MLCIEKSPKPSAAVESTADPSTIWGRMGCPSQKENPKNQRMDPSAPISSSFLPFCTASLLHVSQAKQKTSVAFAKSPMFIRWTSGTYRVFCVFLFDGKSMISSFPSHPSPNWPKSETRAPVWIIALHAFEGATLLFLALAIQHILHGSGIWGNHWEVTPKYTICQYRNEVNSLYPWSYLVKKHSRLTHGAAHQRFQTRLNLMSISFSQHLLTNPNPSWLWSFCALIDAWYAASLRIQWPWDQRILLHPGPCGFLIPSSPALHRRCSWLWVNWWGIRGWDGGGLLKLAIDGSHIDPHSPFSGDQLTVQTKIKRRSPKVCVRLHADRARSSIRMIREVPPCSKQTSKPHKLR